ncbi:MAG TPA: hypothetical protein VGG39_03025 [Polyangiaceae bacterium]|jgi:hypothetical protein
MNEPFDPEISVLLHLERDRPGPGAETRNRVLARVETSIAAHPPSGPAPRMRPAASMGRMMLRPVLAFGLLAVAAAWVGRPSPSVEPSPPSAESPRPAKERAVVVPPVASPAAAVEASAEPRPALAPGGTRPRLETHASTLAEERAILDRARAHLLSGEPAGALAAVDEHARLFRHGLLSEERDALRVEALVAARRFEPARAAAARFHAAYPRSMLAPAVDDAVQAIP